jgi:acetyltransferase-like isoleucine patch superfamily enzyme
MKKKIAILRDFIYTITGIANLIRFKLNRVKYDKMPEIRGQMIIINQGNIKFGKNIIINSSKYKNIIGGDTRSSIVVKKMAQLNIGDGFRLSNSAIYCAERIEIGNNVMVGGSCRIWDTDFHPLNPHERSENPNEGYNTKPIVIADNVFIGGFSIILKGSKIGKGAIIGAGSVVSGEIPEGEIWAGNPAKFIKKVNFNS